MNYMTRMIASLCWHQASACHLVFQIALIPACAGPHHLVHCKMPLLQYCKAFWAALLEGGPFCSQGHPHFQEQPCRKAAQLHQAFIASQHCKSHTALQPADWPVILPLHSSSWPALLSHAHWGQLCSSLIQSTVSIPHSKRVCVLLPQPASPCCQNSTDQLFFSPVEPLW